MIEIILLATLITNLFILNEIKDYLEKQKIKEREKETILRKGLM